MVNRATTLLYFGENMRWTPHAYQRKAIKFGIERPNAGFFLSPGLGKTSIILAIFKILKKKGFVDRMYVVAPLRAVYSVWPKEVKKWDDFKEFSVGILHGPRKEEVLHEKHDIFVINYEGLEWLNKVGLPNKKHNMLVPDESSKVKNVQTRRFKVLKMMLPWFSRVYPLTGSPAANSLMDLYGQCYIMDKGASFGPYITHFREKYFFRSGYGGYEWTLKKGADKEIFARIAPRVLRMSAEDYLDLPELIITDVRLELPEKVMRIYKQMEDQFRVDFEAGRVTAANAAVASMKCRQIANGGIYLTPDTWENLHYAKAEAVQDIVEELQGQPALVSYDFHHDLERLKELLGRDTPHIGSGVSAARGLEYESAWNQGELTVLLGHPQSIGHALNLQGGDEGGSVVLHSLPWSYELYDQFIQRVRRQGQKKRVIVRRIIASNTIDEAIIRSWDRKESTQNSLFSALREYLNDR